jgi:hypothetical protein
MLKPVLNLVAALLLTAASGALHAQQDGELWEMNMSMAEGNGPMMPMMSNKVCTPKSKNAGEQMMKPENDQNCKTELKASGKITRYKTVCVNDGDKTTMEGVQELLGPDHFRTEGTVTQEGRSGKQVMRQSMTMKKLGACKVEPNPGMAAMMPDMKGMCAELAESMHGPSFLGKNAVCQADKPLFCAKVKAAAEASKDPQQYRIPAPDWEESTKACGVDFAAVTRTACQRGADTKNWRFVAEQCPADAKALAARHCTGRSYTAMMQSEYAPVCRAQSAAIARDGVAKDDGGAAPAAETVPKKKDKNMLEKGKDMLKSLF